MSRLRMGIVGAGHIAGSLASVASQFKNVDVTTIASRDQSKADAFAAKYSIAKAYSSYQALMDDKDVDAVYVATPNSVHKENVFAAAQAGKHILCEKPLATSTQDAKDMFDVADKHGVHLTEGFLFRFQPQTIEVMKRIRQGDIGDVLTISAGFGFTLNDPQNPRWDPELGGGALWDVGVYPINLIRAIMGKAPTKVTGSARLTDRGVDHTSTAHMDYGDGRSASIWSSFESTLLRRAMIVGTKGAIDFTYENSLPDLTASAYQIKLGSSKEATFEAVQTSAGNGFVREVDAFSDLVHGQPFSGTSQQETLENTATVEAIIRSFNSGQTTSL